MTDRDGPRSNPYHPNPAQCCERCVFGSGEHAAWCIAVSEEALEDGLLPPDGSEFAGWDWHLRANRYRLLSTPSPAGDIPDVTHAS